MKRILIALIMVFALSGSLAVASSYDGAQTNSCIENDVGLDSQHFIGCDFEYEVCYDAPAAQMPSYFSTYDGTVYTAHAIEWKASGSAMLTYRNKKPDILESKTDGNSQPFANKVIDYFLSFGLSSRQA